MVLRSANAHRLAGFRRRRVDLICCARFVLAVFVFLYLPIALVVLFSFNAGRHASEFTGFSVQWYGKALSNPFLIRR